MKVITKKLNFSNSTSKESQKIIASIINSEKLFESVDDKLLTKSVDFLKLQKISIKKILDNIFIHVYSFYWKKITCNEERLVNMNKSFIESYSPSEDEHINFEEDNGIFSEYQTLVNILFYLKFFINKFLKYFTILFSF